MVAEPRFLYIYTLYSRSFRQNVLGIERVKLNIRTKFFDVLFLTMLPGFHIKKVNSFLHASGDI